MIQYFPTGESTLVGVGGISTYWANMMFCNAVASGATLGDVDDACRPALEILRHGKTESSQEFKSTLRNGFVAVGQNIERLSETDAAAGRLISAGEKLVRVTALYMTAELLMDDSFDPAKATIFSRYRSCFKHAIRYGAPSLQRIDLVSIPFEETTLEGAFLRCSDSRQPAPAVIHMNGGRSSLEWPQLVGIARAFAERGISYLTFDHPGNGSAREAGLHYRHDSESFATAALNYLEARSDVDPDRIGVCGASLGGYYAPRAAAFDHRFKVCLVLGAFYEASLVKYFGDLPCGYLEDPTAAAVIPPARATYLKQMRWAWGAADNRDLYQRLLRFSLKGVMERIRAPLFIIHGQNDVEIPLLNAERMIREAVNSSKAELLIYTAKDGGDQHCSLDNINNALARLADRAVDVLCKS
jgi:pimeloyl-ACP methyl ester carboxylesterase